MPADQPSFDQRKELCSVLASLTDAQWEAETVCAGWNAKHVAAHLIARERNPLAALGIVVPAFSGFHERGIAKIMPYPNQWVIDRLRSGPPWWTRIAQVHIGEDWIHTQDITRGQANIVDPSNELDSDSGTHHPELVRALSRACDRFAPLVLRGVNGPFRLLITDGMAYQRTWLLRPGHRFALRANKANITPDVTITGAIGELLLTLTGRERVANTVFTGNPELINTTRKGISGI